MATVLFDKQGKPINYTSKDYDPITQTTFEKVDPETLRISDVGAGQFNPFAKTENELFSYSESFEGYNFTEDELDEDYDMLMGPVKNWNDIQMNRANMQSEWSKAVNAVGGGLTLAAGMTLSLAGAVANPLAILKSAGLYDGEFTGIVSTSLMHLGKSLEQGAQEWMPIYENPTSENLTDQIVRWSTLRDVIGSTVGFLVPGGAFAKGGAILTKGALGLVRGAKSLKALSTVNSIGKIERGLMWADGMRKAFPTIAPKTAKLLEKTGPLTLMTLGEATLESMEANDELIRMMSPGLMNGTIDAKEASFVSNTASQGIFMRNLALAFTDNALMQRIGRSVDMTKGIKNTVTKEAFQQLQEAPKQGLEEIYQSISSSEAKLNAFKQLEKRNKHSEILKLAEQNKMWGAGAVEDTFAKRLKKYLSSNDILAEGIIGALSGPVQAFGTSVMANGPIKAFRFRHLAKEAQKEIDRVNKLEKEITGVVKDDTKLRRAILKTMGNTSGDLEVNAKAANDVENPEVAASLDASEALMGMQELTEGDPNKEALIKKAFYDAAILKAHKNGTLPALEQAAKETSGTNAYSSDLYEHIKKNKAKLESISNMENQATILNHMNKHEAYNMNKNIIEAKIARIEADPKYKDPKTGEISEVGKLQLDGLRETLNEVESNISKESGLIKELTSTKYQWALANKKVEEETLERAADVMSKTSNKKVLEAVVKDFPELKHTPEYTAALNRITDGKPSIKNKSTNTEELNKAKNPGEKTEQQVEEDTVTADATIKEIIARRLKEAGKSVTKDVFNKMVKKAKKQVSNLSDRVGFTTAMNSASRIVDRVIGKELSNTPKGNKEKANEDSAVKRATRKVAKNLSDDEKLPEELLEEMAELTRKQKENLERVVEYENKISEAQQSLRDPNALKRLIDYVSKKIRELYKEVQKIAVDRLPSLLQKFSNSALSDEANSFGNAIRENFDSFIEYVRGILGDDFVAENWDMLKNIFKGWDSKKTSPLYKSFKAWVERDSSSPLDTNRIDNNIKDNREEFEKKAGGSNRVTHNKKPEDSIAHLSQTYTEMKSASGKRVIVADTAASYDISPIVNPEKYNGGEAINFEIDWDYEGNITLFNEGGRKVEVAWAEIKDTIFDKNNVLYSDADERLRKIKGIGATIEGENLTIFDVVPIAIKGENGEHLGYMHATSYISSRTVDERSVPAKRDALHKRRRSVISHILKGKTVTGKIRKKVIKTHDVLPIPQGFAVSRGDNLAQADAGIPTNVPIAISTFGEIRINDKTIQPSQILNLGELEPFMGAAFTLLPVGKVNGIMQYVAEPLYRGPVSERLYGAALEIMKTFIKKDKSSDIYKAYIANGTDITTLDGAKKALEAYMRVVDEVDQDGNVIKLEEVFNGMSGETALFTLREDDAGNGYIAYGLKSERVVHGLDGENALNEGIAQIEQLFNDGKVPFNVNLTHTMSNDVNGKTNPKVFVVTKESNGALKSHRVSYPDFVKSNTQTYVRGRLSNDGSGNVVYTLQNIVEFDIDPEFSAYEPFKTSSTKMKKSSRRRRKGKKKDVATKKKEKVEITEAEYNAKVQSINDAYTQELIDATVYGKLFSRIDDAAQMFADKARSRREKALRDLNDTYTFKGKVPEKVDKKEVEFYQELDKIHKKLESRLEEINDAFDNELISIIRANQLRRDVVSDYKLELEKLDYKYDMQVPPPETNNADYINKVSNAEYSRLRDIARIERDLAKGKINEGQASLREELVEEKYHKRLSKINRLLNRDTQSDDDNIKSKSGKSTDSTTEQYNELDTLRIQIGLPRRQSDQLEMFGGNQVYLDKVNRALENGDLDEARRLIAEYTMPSQTEIIAQLRTEFPELNGSELMYLSDVMANNPMLSVEFIVNLKQIHGDNWMDAVREINEGLSFENKRITKNCD